MQEHEEQPERQPGDQGRDEGAGADAAQRANVDNGASVTARNHRGDCVLAHQHHAIDVEGEHALPLLQAHFGDIARSAAPDVVVEAVEAAIALHGRFYGSAAFGFPGDIGDVREGLSALFLDDVDGVLAGDAVRGVPRILRYG